MRFHFLPLPLIGALTFALCSPALAQIPAPVTTGEPLYRAEGFNNTAFTVEVLDARRTVSNTLLVRLAVTNHGSTPLQIGADFATPGEPAANKKISGVYAVDPNGQTKYGVLRDAQGNTLCSQASPDIQPGERRILYTQLAPPPGTSSSVNIIFPKAGAINNVPIGLPASGEPLPADAAIGDPGRAPAPISPIPPAPSAAINQPNTNNQPNIYTNLPGNVTAGSPGKAVGAIQSSNSTTPFTVEVLELKRDGGTGGRALLRLALTNNGSGQLDAAGQFTSGLTDLAGDRQISGVYLVDAKSQQRFTVARESQTSALCSKIDPPMNPGERRQLDAQFPALPVEVKSVYLYFPHAAPISEVPVAP